jgi:hypothetical protein
MRLRLPGKTWCGSGSNPYVSVYTFINFDAAPASTVKMTRPRFLILLFAKKYSNVKYLRGCQVGSDGELTFNRLVNLQEF